MKKVTLEDISKNDLKVILGESDTMWLPKKANCLAEILKRDYDYHENIIKNFCYMFFALDIDNNYGVSKASTSGDFFFSLTKEYSIIRERFEYHCSSNNFTSDSVEESLYEIWKIGIN